MSANTGKAATEMDSLLHLQEERNAATKLVIIMVGLPGRGKSYLTTKLTRYLNWLDYKTTKFNLADYRRKTHGAAPALSFYESKNADAMQKRREVCSKCLTDLLQSLIDGSMIAMFDATNSTVERRTFVKNFLETQKPSWMKTKYLWIETIFEEGAESPESQKQHDLSDYIICNSEEYKSTEHNEALEHFQGRVNVYKDTYETLSDDSQSYIKTINIGQKVVCNNVRGFLQGRIVFFIHNVRLNTKQIYFSRHGESEANVLNIIGTDADITAQGRIYAERLAQHILSQAEVKASGSFSVWTSTLARTIQTASHIPEDTVIDKVHWKQLDEVNAGMCDGMTYDQVRTDFPDEFKARAADKLRYRYPQGESYIDVMTRLEPVIFELERRHHPVLVVGHRAVLRCLLSYFLDLNVSTIPHLDVPLHTVMKLEGGSIAYTPLGPSTNH